MGPDSEQRQKREKHFLQEGRPYWAFILVENTPIHSMLPVFYDRVFNRQLESNPHRLPKMWEIVFPFVRNVITC